MLIIVDGSNWIYRAFHAVPDVVSSTGYHTNAVSGVSNMLEKLIREYNPSHVCFVVDHKSGSKFRKELYPEYKANRGSMPDSLIEQQPYIRKIVKAHGIHYLSVRDFEADDVIGTLATKFDNNVIIATGDKDMNQLVSKSVRIINTMSNSTINLASFRKKYGIPVHRFVDYLALLGDSSDNIPGINGIGPVAAKELINEYSKFSKMYNSLKSMKPTYAKKLTGQRENLKMYKKLVKINVLVPLETRLKDMVKEKKNQKKIDKICRKLGLQPKSNFL